MSYLRNQATATRLLTKYGRSVSLRVVTSGTYSPSTGGVTDTYVDETRNAALFDYSAGERNVAGALIAQGDKRCIMDADGAVPQLNHRVVVDSVVYQIVGIVEIKPASTAVLFELQLRA